MNFKIAILIILTVLAGCATEGSIQSVSRIRPLGLLQYAHQQWLSMVNKKYKCSNPTVISASPNQTAVKGVISEIWKADVCGKQMTFAPILTPDGQGGYLVAIAEFGQ